MALSEITDSQEMIEIPSVGGRKPAVMPRQVLAEIIELTLAGAGHGKGKAGQQGFQDILIELSGGPGIHKFPVIGHIENIADPFQTAVDTGSQGHKVVTADDRPRPEFPDGPDIQDSFTEPFKE